MVLPQPGLGGQVARETPAASPAACPADRPASASSRSYRRRCRRRARARKPRSPLGRRERPAPPSDRSPRYSRPGSAGPGSGLSDRAGCPPRRWDSCRRRWPFPRRRPRRPPTPGRCWSRNRRRWHRHEVLQQGWARVFSSARGPQWVRDGTKAPFLPRFHPGDQPVDATGAATDCGNHSAEASGSPDSSSIRAAASGKRNWRNLLWLRHPDSKLSGPPG